jgi:hypothetical protein
MYVEVPLLSAFARYAASLRFEKMKPGRGPYKNVNRQVSVSMSMLAAVYQPLAATCWAANRIDIVAIDPSGQLQHNAWQPEWQAGWDTLGGTFQNVAPTIVSQAENRLDVFGLQRNTGHMLHSSWDGTNWSDPSTVGTQQFRSPFAVTSWIPGRLDVFGLGLDDSQVYRQWVR